MTLTIHFAIISLTLNQIKSIIPPLSIKIVPIRIPKNSLKFFHVHFTRKTKILFVKYAYRTDNKNATVLDTNLPHTYVDKSLYNTILTITVETPQTRYLNVSMRNSRFRNFLIITSPNNPLLGQNMKSHVQCKYPYYNT